MFNDICKIMCLFDELQKKKNILLKNRKKCKLKTKIENNTSNTQNKV